MDQIKNHPLYRKHNIDSAMSSLWEFYKTRFTALFLISLVMSLISQYGSTFINLSEMQNITDPAEMFSKLKDYLLPMAILMVVSLFFTTIMHYYILHKPIDREQNIFTCIIRSLRYFLPYLVIIIILLFVASIAIVLGLMVLIVGVFFSLTYIAMISLFILPVMMAEDAGIDMTISRTVRLSHSVFWPNMGWTAVFIILYLIISMVLSGIVMIPFAGSFIKTFANPEDASTIMNLPSNPLFLIISAAVNALTLPLFPIFAFIIYFNARAKEEGLNNLSGNDQNENRVRVEDLYAKPGDNESSGI